MTRRFRSIARRTFFVLAVLSLLVLCGCRSAGIKKAWTSKDGEGRLKTSEFPVTGSEIHLIIEMASGRDDVRLRVVLYTPGNQKVAQDKNEFAPGKGDSRSDVRFYMVDDKNTQSYTGPFPAGPYHVEMYLDDELEESLDFVVK